MTQSDAASLPVPTGTLNEGGTEPVQVSYNIDPMTWVDEHGDCLFRYAMARLRDETAAEDIVQETLLSAMQSLTSYEGRASERTWLLGILKHKLIDHFRKRAREVPLDPHDTDLSDFDPMFVRPDEFKDHWNDQLSPRIWESSPEDALQQDEFFGVLEKCMSKLPERVAAVFSLKEMNDLGTDQICEILGVTSSNFWVMMHRARMSLRRCIEINWFIKVR